jgi:RNA polymerase sigma-70 factor (ECF subfamily)
MSDREIIDRIIKGDEGAFKELYDRHQRIVFKTCIGFLHNKEDSEDIVQDVFVEVYQSAAKFRNESKISTWLYRIAVNKSLNFIKRNKKNRLLLSLEGILLNGDDAEKKEIRVKADGGDIWGKEESAKILYKSIDELQMNQRIAFTLHKYDDLSYKEIAEVMDLSLSAVESLIHRAKLNLQKKLGRYFDK